MHSYQSTKRVGDKDDGAVEYDSQLGVDYRDAAS
jgi:hypothetical protein